MNLKSSNIFPPSLNIPLPIILFSKTLQNFSTHLTAKFAAKLFTTPVSFPIPKREKVMLESAQKKTINVPSINKDIQMLSYGYSTKKVLFVHGWAGRSTQLYMIADKLLEKGYMVISFDGPSHGNSTGKTTEMPEFLEAISEINKQFGPFDAAIGHSFGAMCLFNAISEGFSINKFVSVGSADKISDVILNFTKNLKVKPIIAKKMKRLFDKKWQRDIDIHSSSNVAKKITIPTLVVHDTTDGDVSVSCAIKIRQNLQNGKLLITEGLGHTKILRNSKVASRIVDFITQQS
ncbi:alpha/beta hydrolase [Tenacibaculum caenipelagi]|uniref:Pimeloyl-ACP methyl ester carboxylesterase n=1 Tax=Tenacibaculum caenipelagi TaxID=1325435 RepID=A0A4R6TC66_9FLAO|nr:alpha/beta hydrolase [Tenacibaculum caenipelagi]TDQ25741.1 pimeloyl-ACP methyl ester carboxylesterase [Tenacibaculum caenipelagi]